MMAWWLVREYSYAGPGFDWLDGDAVEEIRGLVGLGLSLSRPVASRHVPKVARYRANNPKPPTVDIFSAGSAVAVTGRFKALVEEFEPGLHLLVPIELDFHNGRSMLGDVFNCNADVGCVLTAS